MCLCAYNMSVSLHVSIFLRPPVGFYLAIYQCVCMFVSLSVCLYVCMLSLLLPKPLTVYYMCYCVGGRA